MRRSYAIFVLLFAGCFTAAAQEPSKPAPDALTERQGDNVRRPSGPPRREVCLLAVTPNAPLIGFIDSPSPMCSSRPEPDICYVNFYYLSSTRTRTT